ncbi:DEAD/DEAH box helicase [Phanerochaete sordida]|uniref:ATP-dependent RNA helicase n=1 Tax=Phanerochaete sordida TaxID=48140 RepID=A0A9P3G010_9APHY|nr:DEAD/DEAH box helicase [Phanerochaete sordida]
MSFLSSPSAVLARPKALLRLPCSTTRRWIIHHSEDQSFQSLGLKPHVLAGLKAAFPNVQQPTAAQAQFIPAILGHKDVLLKDVTGAGKSFGILLALLSSPRRFVKVSREPRSPTRPAITALVLTPHRDLAYQFLHWVQCLHATEELGDFPLESIAQVMVRGSLAIEEQARAVAKTPPHILICTPQAILEALQQEEHVLPLREVATVIVDEADSMLESPPRKTDKDKYAVKKYLRMLYKHPTPARQVLDAFYGVRHYADWIAHKARQQREDAEGQLQPFMKLASGITKAHLPWRRPQLVITSATLSVSFRQGLYQDSKWLTKEEGDIVKVITHERQVHRMSNLHGSAAVTHSGLVYNVSSGSITNIKNALEAPEDPAFPQKPVDIEAELGDSELGDSETLSSQSAVTAEEVDEGKLESTPSPFPEPAMEAIATVFALEVPRVALLVLHPTASVERAVRDMRRLGIDAHGLDVVHEERGGSYLLREGTAPKEDPTLLVATLATIRGLDMPDLTHVFVLGTGDALDPDAYTHVAGRVGRFGKSGKVITVVPSVYHGKDGKKGKLVDEQNRLLMLYKKMAVKPVRVVHFDLASPKEDPVM